MTATNPPGDPPDNIPCVRTETHGAVRSITLNRPDKRNAIDLELRVVLAKTIDGAAADDAVRAVVITGAGPAFCSGGDISTMKRLPIEPALERIQLAQQVVRSIWNCPKPVLAAVEGSAYGAGTALAAACDRVVGARNARFATTFTQVGLAGDMGISVSLPMRVGVARARQMLMFAEPLSAEQALAVGLIDAVVEPGEALASALRDAERLAAGPAAALSAIKTMLATAGRMGPFEALDREAACQAALFDTDDFAEGIAAFLSKRAPDFGSRKE